MKFKRLIQFLMIISFCLVLFSCGGTEEKEPIDDSDDPIIVDNDYYSADNFVEASKTVTTTKLVTYDGPSFLTSSSDVKVKVNDENLFVYDTLVNHERRFSWMQPTTSAPVVIFDFEGKVHIEVETNVTVTTACVRPLVYGIKPTVSGKTISFDLEYSGNYVLEYNDNTNNVLHIFTNPIEEDPITEEMAQSDDSILYLGPGVYKADAIPVKDNLTIYLAGGAYVYGQIRAEDIENLTIKGRGIFSGSLYDRLSESQYTIPLEIRYCNNVTIEDITFLDPAGWTVALYKSTDVTMNNVKIITARQNGDGISVQACNNVHVNGGFVRTWDDSLVVKNVDGGSTSNVTFDGVVVWTDLAQSMEVGYEANGASMEDITFQNITVVHNFHKAVISMHNADDAQIKNVTYKNITVEDCQTLGDDRNDLENDFLIDISVLYNQDWSNSTNIIGTVKNVTVENVRVYKILDSIISRVNGYSNVATVDGVQIKGVEIASKQAASLEDLKLVTNAYASNVTYQKLSTVKGAIIHLPYQLALTDNQVAKTKVANIEQMGMLVPEFTRSKGDLPYIGVADSKSYTVVASHGAGNSTRTEADDGSGDFTKVGSYAQNAADGNTHTSWISGTWKNQDNEFAAITIDFQGERINVGQIRILGNPENEFYYTYSLQVWGRKVDKTGELSDSYLRLISLKDYEMTPGNGNCIDINITAQEYGGIQLRFYRGSLDSSPVEYEISEVQFYAPSLSYNKSIVDSTPHNDVYNVEKVVDGDPTGTSYYESKSLPAVIVIDLGDVYSINAIVLCLPPSLKWDARTEEIAVYVSDSLNAYSAATTEFSVLVEETPYLFDPETGNRNIIKLDSSVSARFIKLVITSNDIKAGYNAQLSEISVYGE